MSKRMTKEKVSSEKKESENVNEYVTEKWVVETTHDKLSELIKYATHDLDMVCFINDKHEIIFSAKGSSVGDKEILYLCTLPIEETADYICSLPYTLIESIIETALNNEDDTMYEILAARITLLRNKYLCNGNAKMALRKLLRVCQVLGCIGDFDFGDWEAIRDEGNTATNIELIEKFPEGTTEPQKKILNHLVKELKIYSVLFSNNKYKPIENHKEKNIIREIYKIAPDYTHDKAQTFMIMFIETDKEPSIIKNYCREIRKDMPKNEGKQ